MVDQQDSAMQLCTLFSDKLFINCVLQRVQKCSSQVTLYELRKLSKRAKLSTEKSIDTSKINIQNLEKLANAHLNAHIQYLFVYADKHLKYLNELCFASPKYFVNLKSVTVEFTDYYTSQQRQQQQYNNNNQKKFKLFQESKLIILKEDLFFRNINIKSKLPLKRIGIGGDYERCYNITIIDSKFEGLGLSLLYSTRISVSNSQFLNSHGHGLLCGDCGSVYVYKIAVFNSASTGCEVYNCSGDVIIQDIRLSGCQEESCNLIKLAKFQLENVFIQNWEQFGLVIEESKGQLKNIRVQKFDATLKRGDERIGIYLWKNLTVYYDQVQIARNYSTDTGFPVIDEDCKYIPSFK